VNDIVIVANLDNDDICDGDDDIYDVDDDIYVVDDNNSF
jgi:hypothetical protein